MDQTLALVLKSEDEDGREVVTNFGYDQLAAIALPAGGTLRLPVLVER
jgi:hypothetical protein